MLELTDAQIGGWVSAFLLPLFRIGALLMVMPVFGGHLVPVRVRLYLALAITLLLSPNLPPMPEVEALSLRMMLLIAEQILIGGLIIRGFAGFAGLVGMGLKALHVGSLHQYVYWFIGGLALFWAFAGMF